MSPHISKLKSEDSETPKIEEKDVLGLTLGQATIHFSRKSVLSLPSKTSPVGGADNCTSHSKLQVSGMSYIHVLYMYVILLLYPNSAKFLHKNYVCIPIAEECLPL